LARKHGIKEILVLVNHAADQIVAFCASRHNWGIDISCIDDGAPRGTAGAVLGVFDRLADEFLVIYGDTMLDVNLTRFHAFHAQAVGAAATIFLHPNDHPQDSDLVEIDSLDQITAFHPSPRDGTRYYQPSSPFSRDHESPQHDDMGDQHPWSVGFGDTDFRKYRQMTCRFANEGGILGPNSLPTVRAGIQRRVGERVALKVIRPHLIHDDQHDEARLSSSLKSDV
jgi:hypothetical protein